MNNWTIGKRITTGFASVIVIALALGCFAYTRLVWINSQAGRISALALPSIEPRDDMGMNAKNCIQFLYKHIGSPDSADMLRLEAQIKMAIADNNKASAGPGLKPNRKTSGRASPQPSCGTQAPSPIPLEGDFKHF